jgi:hypothetical protein
LTRHDLLIRLAVFHNLQFVGRIPGVTERFLICVTLTCGTTFQPCS